MVSKPSGGGYALVVSFGGGMIRFGRSSCILPPGEYVYSGSALNGVQGRVSRHRREFFSPRDKGSRGHWHIDALLRSCDSVVAVCAPSRERTECRLVRILESKGMEPVEGFGSTDCRSGCRGHLLRSGVGAEATVEAVIRTFEEMGLRAQVCGSWSRWRNPGLSQKEMSHSDGTFLAPPEAD